MFLFYFWSNKYSINKRLRQTWSWDVYFKNKVITTNFFTGIFFWIVIFSEVLDYSKLIEL